MQYQPKPMTDMSNKAKSWDRFWLAVTAVASLMSAIVTAAALYYSSRAISEAGKDAEKSRQQLNTVVQGGVVNLCMAQYFQIMQDADEQWPAANTNLAQRAINSYASRLYGLHFEEYHFFQRRLIPTHIYAVWLDSLRRESSRTDDSQYPLLDKKLFTNPEQDPDFYQFINRVLSSTNRTEDLANDELRKFSNDHSSE